MTDRYQALTVVLEEDTRDDDALLIMNAIRMIRGVLTVTGNVVDIDAYTARTRASNEVREKLFQVIKEVNV